MCLKSWNKQKNTYACFHFLALLAVWTQKRHFSSVTFCTSDLWDPFLWQHRSRATQTRSRRFWHQNTRNDPLFWEENSDIEIGAGLQSLSIINRVPKKLWCFALFYICKTTGLEKYGEVCRNVNVKRAFERFSLEIIRASHEFCQKWPEIGATCT